MRTIHFIHTMGKSRILFLVIVAVLGGLLLFNGHRPNTEFYAEALRNTYVYQTVFIEDTEYHIRGGKVFMGDTEITGTESLLPLALAYAVAVTERSPQFGIPGTDLKDLEQEVNELARVQQEQAKSLRIPSNIHYARTALYPISFLRTLTTAERERIAFIASGTDTDLSTYLDAIGNTIEAQREGANRFAEAYAFLGFKGARFPVFGGVITSDKVEEALQEVQKAADIHESTLRARRACFSGNARSCDKNDLALPLPENVSDTHDEKKEQFARTVEYTIWQPAYANRIERYMVALSNSTCTAYSPAPYFFDVPDPAYSGQNKEYSIRFLGDFFFSTSTASVNSLTKNTVNVSLELYNPMVFYRCFDKGRDVGRAYAVVRTYFFAREHPAIAPEARKALVDSSVSHEDDAIAYLRDALGDLSVYEPQDQPAVASLISLALMFKNNSAGLGNVISEIWSLNENHMILRQLGYDGFSDSLLALVGTHSGFASLFQIYNPSVVPATPELYDRSPEAFAMIKDKYLQYSAFAPAYRYAIIEYLRQLRAFELRAGTGKWAP